MVRSRAGGFRGRVAKKLLVHWTAAGPGAGDADAHSLELPLDRFTQDTSASGMHVLSLTLFSCKPPGQANGLLFGWSV